MQALDFLHTFVHWQFHRFWRVVCNSTCEEYLIVYAGDLALWNPLIEFMDFWKLTTKRQAKKGCESLMLESQMAASCFPRDSLVGRGFTKS